MDLPQLPNEKSALIIGVKGHHDLVDTEIPLIERKLEKWFSSLRDQYPSLQLHVVCSLEEGTDRLIVKLAQKLGIKVTVCLSVRKEIFEKKFDSPESLSEFRSLLSDVEYFYLPLLEDGSLKREERSIDYEQKNREWGIWLSEHAHILLVLWDGSSSIKNGDVGQIVQYRLKKEISSLNAIKERSRIHFNDSESDIVYHLRVSCESNNTSNRDDLHSGWITSNQAEDPMDQLPSEYDQILSLQERFSIDGLKVVQGPKLLASHLYCSKHKSLINSEIGSIHDLFLTADILAQDYKSRFFMGLKLIYGFAISAGISFIVYADLEAQITMIYPYLAFLTLSFSLAWLVARKGWHQRYIQYRALAEGLRIQFYLALAGIRIFRPEKFLHNTYLRSQDMTLGWIRNILRTAGLKINFSGHETSDAAINFVIEQWVGDAKNGQAAYFKRKSLEVSKHLRLTRLVGKIAFLLGGLSALALVLIQLDINPLYRNLLIASMGLLPLIAFFFDAYAQKKADNELVSQYQNMNSIFSKASIKLKNAASKKERQHILYSLGIAALEENTEWLLHLRDRPLKPDRSIF